MKERILEFLKEENKSSAQFAQEIGVQPSGISHIISGRNKPSLDFIVKMLERFPYLSSDWILFGKGTMYRENKPGGIVPDSVSVNAAEPDLFLDQPVINAVRQPEKKADDQIIRGKQVPFVNHSRDAAKIVFFYDNGTFTEYFPEEQ